MLSTVTL